MQKALFIGPPNSGKTALFNKLSGANRKVANYHGITVDTGMAKMGDINLVDLPGIYSLLPSSMDEAVTVSTIHKQNPKVEEYNGAFTVVDVARIESSLSLVLALKEIVGSGLAVIFNKSDMKIAKDFDLDGLGRSLGVPFIITNSIDADMIKLRSFITENLTPASITPKNSLQLIDSSTTFNPFDIDFENAKIEKDFANLGLQQIEKYHRQARDLKASHAIGDSKNLVKLTSKIDRFTLHPIFGGVIFAAIFYFIFHALYTFSGPLMDLIDESVGSFGELVASSLPEGMLNSFLVDGVIAGVGGVIIFLPQIMILFFLLSLLEQSGYR